MLVITVSRAARRWLIGAAFLAGLTLLISGGLWIGREVGSLAVPVGAMEPLSEVPGARQAVALTFDLNWGEDVARGILDLLEARGVKATWFVSGPWAGGHPELLRRLADAGQEIGSQGYEHVSLTRYSPDEVRASLRRAHEVLTRLLGAPPRLLRPPNGDYNETVLQVARDLGYTVVRWGTDSHDWMNPGAHYVTRRVLRLVHSGDIVLFCANDGCRQTLQALPAILEGLAQRELKPVTVSQLLAGATSR